jgi:hypothetical protein
MKNILFRPKLLIKCEMCSICGRAVGMVIHRRKIKNQHPFMCFVCELRFPAEQWEADKEGLFFNLSKNGSIKIIDGTINRSLKNIEKITETYKKIKSLL